MPIEGLPGMVLPRNILHSYARKVVAVARLCIVRLEVSVNLRNSTCCIWTRKGPYLA